MIKNCVQKIYQAVSVFITISLLGANVAWALRVDTSLPVVSLSETGAVPTIAPTELAKRGIKRKGAGNNDMSDVGGYAAFYWALLELNNCLCQQKTAVADCQNTFSAYLKHHGHQLTDDKHSSLLKEIIAHWSDFATDKKEVTLFLTLWHAREKHQPHTPVFQWLDTIKTRVLCAKREAATDTARESEYERIPKPERKTALHQRSTLSRISEHFSMSVSPYVTPTVTAIEAPDSASPPSVKTKQRKYNYFSLSSSGELKSEFQQKLSLLFAALEHTRDKKESEDLKSQIASATDSYEDSAYNLFALHEKQIPLAISLWMKRYKAKQILASKYKSAFPLSDNLGDPSSWMPFDTRQRCETLEHLAHALATIPVSEAHLVSIWRAPDLKVIDIGGDIARLRGKNLAFSIWRANAKEAKEMREEIVIALQKYDSDFMRGHQWFDALPQVKDSFNKIKAVLPALNLSWEEMGKMLDERRSEDERIRSVLNNLHGVRETLSAFIQTLNLLFLPGGSDEKHGPALNVKPNAVTAYLLSEIADIYLANIPIFESAISELNSIFRSRELARQYTDIKNNLTKIAAELSVYNPKHSATPK
jgi:hypothetical protein